jgi:YVTN family beta-propeller protein
MLGPVRHRVAVLGLAAALLPAGCLGLGLPRVSGPGTAVRPVLPALAATASPAASAVPDASPASAASPPAASPATVPLLPATSIPGRSPSPPLPSAIREGAWTGGEDKPRKDRGGRRAEQRKGTAPRPRRITKPSDERALELIETIRGGMTPKSIVATQSGLFFAQNVMYGHSITVFDRRFRRVRTLSDEIDLSRFGYPAFPKVVRGAPVEAALSANGRHMYVSQYSMYGPGFANPGFDLCVPRDKIDRSFVYRISVRTLRKTAAYRVGEVPKYLAASPDGRYLLVANWCSWDLSVVDLDEGREVERIPIGANPRGIAFSPDSRTAYVSLVGEGDIEVVDMRKLRVVRSIPDVGVRPRHLVMSPDGRHLYVTVEGQDVPGRADGRILKLDPRSGRVLARSPRLVEPRSTVLAPDGRSLYVVDYHPGTVVKIATRDMSVLQKLKLGHHPIGITYDSASRQAWVAGYTGTVWVLKDR